MGQLVLSAEGTLYAANSNADGGMERCLNPTYPLGPSFESVSRGLEEGAKLVGLWLVEHQLWSVDSAHTSLVSYYDSLTQPVSLTSPLDKAPGVGIAHQRHRQEHKPGLGDAGGRHRLPVAA